MGALRDRLQVVVDRIREGVADALHEGLAPLGRPAVQPIPVPVRVQDPRHPPHRA